MFILLLSLLLCSTLEGNQKTFLVFGGQTGWIGQKVVRLLTEEGHRVFAAQSRLEMREAIVKEIEHIKPDCVINAAGVTGVPNVDWCEDHKQETIRANIIGALNLADITSIEGIHLINMGTGCIYEYDEEHPMYSDKGFTEEDAPNFHGSFYSHTKCMLDNLLSYYPHVLNLRLRMPIASDLHPRSFITKITRYKKVVNIPNSMTILEDLLPLLSKMADRRLTGTFNFVNPGVISHNEILDLYKGYIDPQFEYVNFSVEEQNSILKARRSNNYLDATKLMKEFPEIRPIKEAIVDVFKRMQQQKGVVC